MATDVVVLEGLRAVDQRPYRPSRLDAFTDAIASVIALPIGLWFLTRLLERLV